jgi:MFS transporter, MHS family, shikimate and dehydroshikimate transport protein
MGIVSVLIGLIPPASTIGLAAPILLVLLRLLQGVAVGGEWGGAALLALEHAPAGRRGFASSVANVGAATGGFLSTIIVLGAQSMLTAEQFHAWGWRIPFLLSAVLVAIGLWIRMSVQESPMFKQLMDAADGSTNKKERSPLASVLTQHPKAVVIAAGASIGAFVYLALMGTFALSMMTKNGITESQALMITAAAAIVHIVTIPFFGALSDRVGRRPVILGGSMVGVVFSYPMLWSFTTGNPWLCLGALLVGNALVHSAVFGALASFISEMFGTGNRYSGASLGYQLGGTLGSGFAPLIAVSILASGDGNNFGMVALFASAICLISVISTYVAKESNGSELSTGKQLTVSTRSS